MTSDIPTPFLTIASNDGVRFISVKNKAIDHNWPQLEGEQYRDVAWSHDSKRLAVAHSGGEGLSVVDINNREIEPASEWPSLPGDATAVAWGTVNRLVVGHEGSPYYSVISEDKEFGDTINLPGVTTDIHQSHWYTYITHHGGNGWSLVRELHTGALEDHTFHELPSDTPSGQPHGLSLVFGGIPTGTFSDGHILWVGHHGGDHLTVLRVSPSDLQDYEVFEGWPALPGSVYDLALTQDYTKLAVAHAGGGGLTVIDTFTREVESGWPMVPAGAVGRAVDWSRGGERLILGYSAPFPETGSFMIVLDTATKTEELGWPTQASYINGVEFGSRYVPKPERFGQITNYLESYDWHVFSSIEDTYTGDDPLDGPIHAVDVPSEVWEAWKVGPNDHMHINDTVKVGKSFDGKAWVHHFGQQSADYPSVIMWHNPELKAINWAIVRLGGDRVTSKEDEVASSRQLYIEGTGVYAPDHGVTRFKGDIAWARSDNTFVVAYEGGPAPKENNCYVVAFERNNFEERIDPFVTQLAYSPETVGPKHFTISGHNGSGGMPLTTVYGFVHEGDGEVISKTYTGIGGFVSGELLDLRGSNTHPELGNFLPTASYGCWRQIAVWGDKDGEKWRVVLPLNGHQFNDPVWDHYLNIDPDSDRFLSYGKVITTEETPSNAHSGSAYIYQDSEGQIVNAVNGLGSGSTIAGTARPLFSDNDTVFPYEGELLSAANWGRNEHGQVPNSNMAILYRRGHTVYGANFAMAAFYPSFNPETGGFRTRAVLGGVYGPEIELLSDVGHVQIDRGTAHTALIMWVDPNNDIFVSTLEKQSREGYRRVRSVWQDMGYFWGIDAKGDFVGILDHVDHWNKESFVSGNNKHFRMTDLFSNDHAGGHGGAIKAFNAVGDYGFYFGPGRLDFGTWYAYLGRDFIESQWIGEIGFAGDHFYMGGEPGWVQWDLSPSELNDKWGVPLEVAGYANMLELTEDGDIVKWHHLYHEEQHGDWAEVDTFTIDGDVIYWADGWSPYLYRYSGSGSSSILFEDPWGFSPLHMDTLPNGDIVYTIGGWWDGTELFRRVTSEGELVKNYFLEMGYRRDPWWMWNHRGIRTKPDEHERERVYVFGNWDWIPVVAEFDLEDEYIVNMGTLPSNAWGSVDEGFGIFSLPTIDLVRWDMPSSELVIGKSFEEWIDWKRITQSPEGEIYIYMQTDTVPEDEMEFNPSVAPPEGWLSDNGDSRIIDVVTRADPNTLEEYEHIYAWFWDEETFDLRGGEEHRHSFYFRAQHKEFNSDE